MSPAPKSLAHHLILPHLTSHDSIPTPDSSLLLTLALLPDSQPAYYFFHSLPLFCDSYLVFKSPVRSGFQTGFDLNQDLNRTRLVMR